MSETSSSVCVCGIKHEVFLSFRGEDTRHGFTGYLYDALRRKNIRTFIDDHALAKGDNITPSLEEAIEASLIYVIVFSPHYASSSWCLDELTKILECKKRYRRDVIPVFYKVDPSTVRHQKGTYSDAFVKHQQRYNDSLIQRWKLALTQAAQFSGWDSTTISYEYKLVQEIVNDIFTKVNLSFQTSSNTQSEGLVGIQKHIEQIQNMLQLDSPAVKIIGIWGIGGIGKSTLAAAAYHKLATQFQSSALVLDVQKEIERHGIYQVRRKYSSDLRGKILLVLDDVNNSDHFRDLKEGNRQFSQGSRIILTSRDLQVLKNADADEIYQVEGMNFQDSLRLFSLNAFKQDHPNEHYMDVSRKILDYAKGIPLTLRVLGLLLHGRTKEDWESELEKLKKLPEHETFKVLKLSYDGLDEEQKDIFLDIACFYRGHDMNTVKQTLESCGFSAGIGMRVLIDRGLMSILEDEILMHDLIQETGQEIVRREGVNNPGKRSRLWKHEDIYHVMRKNRGTDAVKCMFLDMCQIKEVQLDPQTFKMMDNLRVLNFYDSNRIQDSKLRIPSFLESLPDELRFLRWDGFPQGSLPVDFSPENLVELHMRDSKLEQLWERDQHLPNLKRLDLSGSRKLIQIPDLSGSPNIEEVILSQCKELIQVYSSCFLGKLNCIRLDGCTNLRSLNTPSNILSTLSGIIVLKGCCNLEMFSVSKETMGVTLSGCSHNRSSQKTKPSRQYLRNSQDSWISVGAYNKKDRGIVLAEKTNKSRSLFKNWSATFDPIDSADSYEEPWDSIHLPYLNVLRRSSPSLFPSLNELCRLNLSYCESLTSLPTDLCKLKFLRGLDLRGCSNLEKFPEIEEPMENLMVLILDETAIQELPLSLHLLVGLQELSLHMCRMLEFIPPSIGSLTKLSKLDLTYCESLETLPSSIFKLKLTKLDLRGCSRLRNFSEIMEPAESFADLRLTKTAIQKLPSSLDNLAGIQNLQLNLCRDFEFVPKSISNVTLLSKIDFSGCEKLSAIPSNIGRLSLLGELSLHGTGIVTLPESIVNLSSLKSLDLSDCKRLECIPQLPSFLKHFLAFDCPSIREVSHSRFNVSLSANSKEGVFKFYLTNCQELDASAQSNLAADAWIRITEDAHRSVFYCYPGNTVPHWFPYCCKGHSVTLKVDSLKWHEDKFIGFALCIVWGIEGINHERSKHGVFSYRFSFDCDDGTHIIASHDMLRNYFTWKGGRRFIEHGAHTFMWKYYLNPSFIWQFLSRAHDFTFEICMYGVGDFRPTYIAYDKVIECGISPLFRKEKDNDAGSDECFNFERFSNYDIGEPSGSKTAYKKAEEGTEDGC